MTPIGLTFPTHASSLPPLSLHHLLLTHPASRLTVHDSCYSQSCLRVKGSEERGRMGRLKRSWIREGVLRQIWLWKHNERQKEITFDLSSDRLRHWQRGKEWWGGGGREEVKPRVVVTTRGIVWVIKYLSNQQAFKSFGGLKAVCVYVCDFCPCVFANDVILISELQRIAVAICGIDYYSPFLKRSTLLLFSACWL